jgi:myo-inositol-1(or 4)-monophosphatase
MPKDRSLECASSYSVKMRLMDEYLNFAKDLADQAGGIMRHYFRVGMEHTLKADNSPVTIADEKINEIVIERVKERFPEHGVLGEEASFGTEAKDLWVVDPIDGTIPFTKGVPTNAFSLALVRNGIPIVGVIFDPYMERMYSATEGGGAFVNEEVIRVDIAKSVEKIHMTQASSRWLSNLSYLELLKQKGAKVFGYGSTVYELAMVASGQLSAMVHGGEFSWDVAAAKIIVEEAGGVTSDLRGNNQRYDGEVFGFIAASTPELHAELVQIYAESLT